MDREIRRKRFHLVSATSILLATLLMLYLLSSVLLSVLASALIAYILMPVTSALVRIMPWRESRPELSRGIAVGIIFIAAIATMAGILVLVIPPTIDETRKFIADFPSFYNSALDTIKGWVTLYTEEVPEDVQLQIEEAMSNMGSVVVNYVWQALPRTFGYISGTFAVVVGLATMPVLIFYFVKDAGKIGFSILSPFPHVLHPYLTEFAIIADRTLGGYLRGQLILGLMVGTAVTIGLLLLDVPFALALGIVAGITELIPILGPVIGGAVGVLVTLATAPEKIIWVVLLYLGVQLVENTLLVPRVQAGTLKLHPVAVLLIIIIGSHFFGILGIIFGPPLVSMGKDVATYFLQEWKDTKSAGDTALLDDSENVPNLDPDESDIN